MSNDVVFNKYDVLITDSVVIIGRTDLTNYLLQSIDNVFIVENESVFHKYSLFFWFFRAPLVVIVFLCSYTILKNIAFALILPWAIYNFYKGLTDPFVYYTITLHYSDKIIAVYTSDNKDQVNEIVNAIDACIKNNSQNGNGVIQH